MNMESKDTPAEEEPARIEPEGMHPADKNQQWDRIRKAIKSDLNRKVLAMMETCVHCGLCAEACHYYTSTAELYDPDQRFGKRV